MAPFLHNLGGILGPVFPPSDIVKTEVQVSIEFVLLRHVVVEELG